MTHYDRRLVRPNVNDLVTALDDATRAASVQGAAVAFDRAHWQQFVGEIRGEREGVRQFKYDRDKRQTPVVGIAWWTDTLGRRLFRVWGVPADADDPWPGKEQPPMWYLAPDRFVRRLPLTDHDRQSAWLAVCECGACGLPESLGWDGERCRDCQQGQAPIASLGSSVFRNSTTAIDYLAFSPDGTSLAAASDEVVHVWNLPARQYQGTIQLSHLCVNTLDFSPDGRHLLVSDVGRMLHWFDLQTGKETAAIPTPSALHYVGYLEDGQTLALAGEQDWEIWTQKVGVWGLATGASEKSLPGCVGVGSGVLFRSDGYQIYHHHFTYRHQVHNTRTIHSNGSVVTLAVLSDSLLTCVDRSGRLTSGEKPWYWLESRELNTFVMQWHRFTAFRCDDAHFSPAGGCLVGNNKDWLHVMQPELEGSLSALQAGDARVISALAFSRDDETLAVGTSDGTVRLWPWRRLLAV